MKLFILLALTVWSANAMAYGSSSSKKACQKPRFSEFTPADNGTIEPQSAFSFVASGLTNPDSIQVSIKKQAVEIVVEPKNNAYLVTGTLPESLQNTYVRVSINATGKNRCKGSDGWLLLVK